MRLDRVYIDGFKNLKGLELDLDERHLTTVIIGQNGAGKSNLIEALVEVFRFVDIGGARPRFTYEVDYRLSLPTPTPDGKKVVTKVRLTNRSGRPEILANDALVTPADFSRRKAELFPDLVFGYYSGGGRRLEHQFDAHQRRYYDRIKRNNDASDCRAALRDRRLFYCRSIHGVFALLALFAFPDAQVSRLLQEKLGVVGFHSALAHFREPWFAKGSKGKKLATAADLWGADGPAGACARALRDHAFHPFALTGNAIDDYRDKKQDEAQLAAFLRNVEALESFSKLYRDDQEMFYALEAADISDLFRELYVWVTRVNDESGDVSFTDLSDGERQLLMVLGLIRVSRGKRALFLLDEPDTHLNPHWQLTYLDLIQRWAGIAADAEDCHIVLTSHNPLTIAALRKSEVRVMYNDDDEARKVRASPPYADPRGLGFTSTLTEIFGLPTSLDLETQGDIDDRNLLVQIDQRTAKQERDLIAINDKLNRLGFMFEDREPLYHEFLQAWRDVRYANRPPLTPAQVAARQAAMRALISQLLSKDEAAT